MGGAESLDAADYLSNLALVHYSTNEFTSIALAGANQTPRPGQEDGILTALEVAEMDLTRVDMAVLSACETGLGKEAGGEGLLGLQRAFQVAGARPVVVSLWKVPDAATRVLMERFYTNLWQKKMGRLAALREAQLWMLREGRNHKGIRQSLRSGSVDWSVQDKPGDGRLLPYAWAGFVLSGDWR